jgi:hypothetical protein
MSACGSLDIRHGTLETCTGAKTLLSGVEHIRGRHVAGTMFFLESLCSHPAVYRILTADVHISFSQSLTVKESISSMKQHIN